MRHALVLLVALAAGWQAAAAEPPLIVASIRPLHGLAAALTEGVAAPRLLLDGGASPHGYALRPSAARDLQDADLVILVGAGLDRFVERHLESARSRVVVRMSDAPGVRTLAARAPGFGEHAGEHDHAGADDPLVIDPHLWLDPQNALATADAVLAALLALDPARAAVYRRNHRALQDRLEALDDQTADQLRAADGRPLITFHDALQYFTARYGLADSGSIASDPERPPGARTIRALRQHLLTLGPTCIAIEPGPEPALLDAVRADLPVAIARLDPLGRDIPPGARHYERMIAALADEVVRCLAQSVASR